MCKCTPSIKTPFCGKIGCEWPKKESAELFFYVQDKRTYIGNSMMWWERHNHGYVCDVRKARVWTMAEIKDRWPDGSFSEKYVAWPRSYIDDRISHHIDTQHCDRSEAINVG